jgi:hypothetical protein
MGRLYTPEEMGQAGNEVVAAEREAAAFMPHKALPAPAEDKARSRREKMIDTIAELGGDAAHAATLENYALIAYGKQCRAAATEAAAEAQAATAPVLGAMARNGEKVVMTGVYHTGGDKPFINANVCKFALDCSGEPVKFAVFPKNNVAWALLVDDTGDIAIDDGEVLEIAGRVEISPVYGTSVLVDTVKFVEFDGVSDAELAGLDGEGLYGVESD